MDTCAITHTQSPHNFHIPVMGLAFTIDTPLKVARFGINSVISIVDDILIERMREYYCKVYNKPYEPIKPFELDARARRITAYLNVVHEVVQEQMNELGTMEYEPGNDLDTYFRLLPPDSPQYALYQQLQVSRSAEAQKHIVQELTSSLVAGDINVNIMTKLDKTNYDRHGKALPMEYNDALAALRGFAHSSLRSSVVLSAGLNPRLFSYIEQFPQFFPDGEGKLQKKIILKVSDFRSAYLQGKILAKKGIWVNEFRIESGLNCGGHAFATDGLLMGPILQEFLEKREQIRLELRDSCNSYLRSQSKPILPENCTQAITAQGGIGTHQEHEFLQRYYGLNSVGWGSPFLLVPEATNVEPITRHNLALSEKEDIYLSHASPLGTAFQMFRKSPSEHLRLQRIAEGKPGGPCRKNFLVSNTEFTDKPICTASREYQTTKIAQLTNDQAPPEDFLTILEKTCLCQGLAASALQNAKTASGVLETHTLICPSPNIAYFKHVTSLQRMISHIYGKCNLLDGIERPHVFINELEQYVNYFRDHVYAALHNNTATQKQRSAVQTFRDNLLGGIQYYHSLCKDMAQYHTVREIQEFKQALEYWQEQLLELEVDIKDEVWV